MNQIQSFLQSIDNIVWGPPLLILLVGTGIYLTYKLKLLQILKLPLALKYVFSKDEEVNDENAKEMFQVLEHFAQHYQQQLVQVT